MLIEYIERMRKEPPHVRRRAVAFWTTVIVIGVVVVYLIAISIRGTILTPRNTEPLRTSNIAAPYESGQ